jgi:ketosteroid isomerase-like protein
MSRENVEVMRSYYAASNRRDVNAALEHVAPEIEFHLAGVFPDLDSVYRGHVGVRKFLNQFAEPWEDLSIALDRVVDAGDRVLAFIHFRAKGRDGIEVQLPLAHLWTMRDGRAVRMDAYSDQQRAFEAAGLSESATSRENADTSRRASRPEFG